MLKKIFLIFMLSISLFAKDNESQKPALSEVDVNKEIIKLENDLNEVLDVLNSDDKFKYSYNSDNFNTSLKFLKNKIKLNTKQNNILAVNRDKIKVLFLNEKKLFETTLEKIKVAKSEFKDKKYFNDLLNSTLEKLNDSKIKDFQKIYLDERESSNKISKALVENYLEAYNQHSKNLYILEYLSNNISSFRKTNFFIDEFNLQYLVKKIDSIEGISFLSKLSSYYFKFTIGEIVVVLFIILFFRLLNLKIITFLASFVSKVLLRNEDEDTKTIKENLKTSLDSPIIFALYTLSIQISIYILVKDPLVIAQIMPWINTTYMALFTWALYSILNNSITIYAHNLLEKYPNVRKEMIVFVLRIIKIILILLVILFLFTQLGIDIKAIAASLGVGGIAIALASKDTLANFFGSLNIMTDNSFSQGDWIKTTDVEGTVVDIRMRTTRIRTFDNAMITIPNSRLANSHIMNWSKRKLGRRIKLSIGITYESNMQDIKNLKDDIHEMLANHPLIASPSNNTKSNTKKFEAIKKEDLQGIKRTLLVYIDELDASSINILVYCFSRSPVWEDWLEAKEDVIMQISKLVEKNNCEFAYNTQTLFLKNENNDNIKI